MLRRDVIVDGRGDDHHAENEHGPVHFLDGRERHDGEKRHDETDEEEDQGGVIDGAPERAESPAARQQRLAAPPLEANAADRGNVRENQGRVREADDGVERHVRPEVEGRDEERYPQDDDESVDGNIPPRSNLSIRCAKSTKGRCL